MGCPNDKRVWGNIYIEDIELKSVPVQNKTQEVTSDLLKVSFCTSYLRVTLSPQPEFGLLSDLTLWEKKILFNF